MAELTAQNTVAWAGYTYTQHNTRVNELSPLGFRTTSLSLYGDPAAPTFAAIMVKRDAPLAEIQVYPESQAQLQAYIADLHAQHMGLYLVAAVGPPHAGKFAASFRPVAAAPTVALDLTRAQFETENANRHTAGDTLLSLAAYGDAAELCFAAVWSVNSSRVAWSTECWDASGGGQTCVTSAATLQQRFNALTASGARLTQVVVLPDGSYSAAFADTALGPWYSQAGMTAEVLQTVYNQQTAAGLQPLQISAGGPAATATFAAIYATRDNVDPVAPPRSQGPVTVPAIDAIMQQFMNGDNLPGAALAITNGTQLLYARGYTNAPASYPDITPQTYFRQASCSKMFIGVAMWKLLSSNIKLANGSSLGIDTPIQTILNLKQPNGAAPADPRWSQITIRHLLQSDSGIPQWLCNASASAALAFNTPLPATANQLLSYATSLPLTGNPGDPQNSVYGNFDYILLGNILALVHGSGVGHVMDALNALVLTPLGLTHTRASASLAGAQLPGEAHYHMRAWDPANAGWPLYPLDVAPSSRDADRRLVATQYGYTDLEIGTSAGGMSSSVVDMARLVAMYSDTSPTALLGKLAVQSLMEAAYAAQTQVGPDPLHPGQLVGSHGYYGLDWASPVPNSPTPAFIAGKGGWLPGQGTVVQFITGSLGIVCAYNANAISNFDWLNPIAAIAAAHPWAAGDLFVSAFGMKPLGSATEQQHTMQHVTSAPPLTATLAQLRASMAAQYR